MRDQVELTAGATLRMDIVLEMGSVGETVSVQAQASPLEAETTRVATTINTKLVRICRCSSTDRSAAWSRWR